MRTLIIICTVFILSSCSDSQVEAEKKPVVETSQPVTETNSDSLLSTKPGVEKLQPFTDTSSDSLVLTLTRQALTAMKNKDYKNLAKFIHPTSGVRFSPYGYIDTTEDVVFTRNTFLDRIKTRDKVHWGSYDGSGDSIFLTIQDYFSDFVYDADFLNAEKTSLNKMIGFGNSLNNLETIYKGCEFTESYFSGFDKKFEGMDWCCLRLVFKKHAEKFYLVGIVHDQWTI